jgi:hypothetical protein
MSRPERIAVSKKPHSNFASSTSKPSGWFVLQHKGCLLQEIYIRVWRSNRQQDWSVDIDGERYENVAGDVIGDLVDSALSFSDSAQPKTATHAL